LLQALQMWAEELGETGESPDRHTHIAAADGRERTVAIAEPGRP